MKGVLVTSITVGKHPIKMQQSSTFQNREIKMQWKYDVLQ